MWSKLWILFFIFYSLPSLGEVLIQAMETSSTEYQAALHLEPGSQTYVNWQKNNLLKEAPIQELRRLYTSAMASYLQGSHLEAQKAFEKVAELRHQHHWPESARFLIFTACLRRAQLETKSYVKQSWLAVSLEIGWDFEPDSKIFPPPFIQEWSQQKSQLEWIPTHALLADSYLDGILISGHFYDLKKTIPKIPKVRARVTLLSNQKKNVTSVLSTDQIAKGLSWSDWLVSQKCKDEKTWEFDAKNKFQVIWPSSCTKKLNLEITQMPQAFGTTQTPVEKSKVSNSWIWWGLGTLAVAYVIYEKNKQNEDSKNSSSTYGF